MRHRLRPFALVAVTALVLGALAVPGFAGPEKVAFPAHFDKGVLYPSPTATTSSSTVSSTPAPRP